MKTELIESIEKMVPNGNRLELPQDDHFKNYAQVKIALLDAGGKYKRCGFEFTADAKEVQDRLTGGEVINDKKKYQFFPTPAKLARRLVMMADIQAKQKVLEPSAGQGAIANIMFDDVTGTTDIMLIELMPENVKALERQGHTPVHGCFLEQTEKEIGLFDRIVANPPFTKNQDIDHIRHMFSLLEPGGKIVSIASRSWINGSQKKQVAFKDWLAILDATVTDIPAGEFKESGTNIASVIIEICKTD